MAALVLGPGIPRLQQGTNLKLIIHNYTACLFTIGTTAAASKDALVSWLDAIAVKHSPGCLVHDANGVRIPGLFHGMARPNHLNMLQEFSSRTMINWMDGCRTANLSLGKFLTVDGDVGSLKFHHFVNSSERPCI